MVFVTIYKKNHVPQEIDFSKGFSSIYENPRGIGDLVLVFKHEIKITTTVDNLIYKIDTHIDKIPFMFIPLIDDGIDECIYLPELPPEDMLFIEHLLPEWYYKNTQFRNVDPTTIEEYLKKNLYCIIENIVEQNELYDHVVNVLTQSKVLLDGAEYHKKILNYLENNGITFLPEDPEIVKIKNDLKIFSS